MAGKLLEVKDLSTEFRTERGTVKAVDHVSFHVDQGEIVGIVGESGCGKSVTAMSVMNLIPSPPGEITSGEILFEGKDLRGLKKEEISKIVGCDITMVFQDPLTSLNPLLTCGSQIAESLRIHKNMKKKEAFAEAVELLTLVGIPSPEKRAKEYPYQLSGGMRQRVMIAIALACSPKLLIADEPTTALDVTIQAQILELLKKLQKELSMAVIFITHDMGIIADIAHRVIVMYAGHVVEEAPVKEFFHDPKHPYTKSLLKAVPRIDMEHKKLFMIKGSVPDLTKPVKGCLFAGRCPMAEERCFKEQPKLKDIGGRKTACLAYGERVVEKDG